jgi:hypothetical protein
MTARIVSQRGVAEVAHLDVLLGAQQLMSRIVVMQDIFGSMARAEQLVISIVVIVGAESVLRRSHQVVAGVEVLQAAAELCGRAGVGMVRVELIQVLIDVSCEQMVVVKDVEHGYLSASAVSGESGSARIASRRDGAFW